MRLLCSQSAHGLVFVVVFISACDRSTYASPTMVRDGVKEVTNHRDEGMELLSVNSGPVFQNAVNMVNHEFQTAAKTISITDRVNYGLALHDSQELPALKVDSEDEGLRLFPDQSKESHSSWFQKTNQKPISEAGRDTTAEYLKIIESANDMGDYSFILTGKGSDVGVMAVYMSMVKKAPHSILIAHNEMDPKVNLRDLNDVLAAMKSDVHYGYISCPEASIIEEETLVDLSKNLKERFQNEKRHHHLVVLGPGKPILDLIHDPQLLDFTVVTHIAPYEWDDLAGTFKFSSTYGTSDTDHVERKLLQSGLKRIVIPKGDLHLGDFTYVRDATESMIFLMDQKDITLGTSGGVKDMNHYLNKHSPSNVGRGLRNWMSEAAKILHNSLLSDLGLIKKAQFKMIEVVKPSNQRKEAYYEVLRIARQIRLSNDNDSAKELNEELSEQDLINYWNQKGSHALEDACKEIPRLENLKINRTSPSLRDYAAHVLKHEEMFTGKDSKHHLTKALVSHAVAHEHLTPEIHASDAQALITARTHSDPEIGFLAVRVTSKDSDETRSFELEPSEEGTTLFVIGHHKQALLRSFQGLFHTASPEFLLGRSMISEPSVDPSRKTISSYFPVFSLKDILGKILGFRYLNPPVLVARGPHPN